MHRREREPAIARVTPRARIEAAAGFAVAVALVIWAAGAALIAAGVIPDAFKTLNGPLLAIITVAFAVTALAQAAGAFGQAKPLRFSRCALGLFWAALFAGQAGMIMGMWADRGAVAAMLAAGAVIGAALLADAARDARRHAYPRLAVTSSALAGTGLMMITGSVLSTGDGPVWTRLFIMGAGLLGAAGFGLLRLRRIHRSRADMLAGMGLGDG
jgi:hypothetical protein